MKASTIPGLTAAGMLLAGCATQPMDPVTAYYANEPITCAAGSECEEMWSRAVMWVVRNSETKIQIQTDNLIETYNPSKSVVTAYSVTMTAVGSGRYEILLKAACSNMFVCDPNPALQKAAFYRAVTGR